MPEKENSYKPVRMITDAREISLMRQVGDVMGVRIITLAEEGQEYTPTGAYRGLIEKGKAFVEVQSLGGNRNLSRFWAEVKKLSSEVGEAPSK